MQDPQASDKPGSEPSSPAWSFLEGILFTGHMIDAPGRVQERFPPRAEGAVRNAIHSAVSALLAVPADAAVGVAGGACGGDILFHEVCAELGVATRMLLALPPDEFVRDSVIHADADWLDRFYSLVQHLGPGNVQIMGPGDGLLEESGDNRWERANFWMIEEVLRLAPRRTLLALWDGQGGDGPGGTEHLVHIAADHGVRIATTLRMQSLIG